MADVEAVELSGCFGRSSLVGEDLVASAAMAPVVDPDGAAAVQVGVTPATLAGAAVEWVATLEAEAQATAGDGAQAQGARSKVARRWG
jgi:hypothetical protein